MGERYLAWVYQDERDPRPELERVEPTDRLWRCNVMSIENRFVSQDVFCNPTEHGTGEGCTDECGMVIVVSVPKEDDDG